MWFESENSDFNDKIDDLNDEIDDLKNERDDLQSQLNNSENNIQFYKESYSENNISVASDIEYGLLKKYSLTKFIVPEENFETYKLGQLRVKYKVNSYKEYSELLKAQRIDYFMKYSMLLSTVYDGDGFDHFYEYYPY
ncbi:hypothetical protein G1K66_06695 [Tenacibaculum finnmarkense]|uniref:hypothetical protein n=1 Tax=Tenacibaculum finnmarkense TaxID=2781243 RepID=UPI00187B8625|nr:hypothetical protein [Tenacibaculum finnmarkense]MBE7634275.1 hypothetical protein [Tenacibaculum finnmarkense genomovar ulcerans]MCD8430223.1 hypothetical protein [Tenacibaculum finnmarkense genomovar ulcerans]MCG8812955.1 hypothetical protein [Tenacibaculum finnmarkense]